MFLEQKIIVSMVSLFSNAEKADFNFDEVQKCQTCTEVFDSD